LSDPRSAKKGANTLPDGQDISAELIASFASFPDSTWRVRIISTSRSFRRLVPLLLDAGYTVAGTTRSPEKAAALEARGVEPVAVDVFDARALAQAVAGARPEVVIHQLTDLPPGLDPALMAEATVRNARVRTVGTRNLAAAAVGAGARRLIAQSIAWAYAPGGEPHAEEDPLDLAAGEPRATSIRGIVALESAVLNTPPLEGIVLRYGQLYGPGTGSDRPSGSAPLHVDAAALAACLSVATAQPGTYNIAEANGSVATDKARRDLRWDPSFRLA